jgi:hypothetical protein
MPYEIEHCHYHRLDPATHPRPALFKVYDDGALVGVVREPIPAELKAAFESLFGNAYADSTENYRVDCRQASDPLESRDRRLLPETPVRVARGPRMGLA